MKKPAISSDVHPCIAAQNAGVASSTGTVSRPAASISRTRRRSRPYDASPAGVGRAPEREKMSW